MCVVHFTCNVSHKKNTVMTFIHVYYSPIHGPSFSDINHKHKMIPSGFISLICFRSGVMMNYAMKTYTDMMTVEPEFTSSLSTFFL